MAARRARPRRRAPASPAASDLALILWDMAQAEHLEESSALASRIQEELAEVTGSEGRGVKQAPFRVLVGAAMPAVLVEIAFISNPEEEKLLASDAYQSKVAAALAARHRALRSTRTARAQRRARPPCRRDREAAPSRDWRPGRATVLIGLGLAACSRRGASRRRAGRGSCPAAAPATSRRRRQARPAPQRTRPPRRERTINVKLFFEAATEPGPGHRGARGAVLQRPGAADPAVVEELVEGSQAASWRRCPGDEGPGGVRDRARRGLRGPVEGGLAGARRRLATPSCSPSIPS